MSTTRRAFLIGGVRVVAAAPFVPLLSAARPARARGRGDRALVVLQLTGGNDGLNTVIPHRQDEYYRLRPGLALPRGELARLDDEHGLHPSLAGLAPLYDAGRLAVVHGVGYPRPDRSHFRSMDVWHTADPDAPTGATGWLGRLADQIADEEPGALCALHVGDEDLPRALSGRTYFCPTVRSAEGFRLRAAMPGFADARARLLAASDGPPDLAFLREAARGTVRAAERMESLSARADAAPYPDTELARRLRLVARLTTGGFGARIFHLALDGFDTHARQRGPQADLLSTLGGALAAFQADLEASGAADQVVTFVFSEFGRRARENGSGGTDHGAGAPVLLAGAPVHGGLHGTPPDLLSLVEEDVPATTDLRSVYATLERSWLGLEPSSREHAPLALV